MYSDSSTDFTYIHFTNTPMASFTSIHEVESYPSPELAEFDFSEMSIDESVRNHALYGCGSLCHIFILASRLRGMDQLLFDMVAEPKMAEAVIEKVALFALELNSKTLALAGDRLDSFNLWDYVAMQSGLLMSPQYWRRYLKGWYAKIFSVAKKSSLYIFYHYYGSFHQIIPDLIDIDVDILDPIQTSAHEMDLKTLKKRYGNRACWHGGIDVQHLLPFEDPTVIKYAVDEARELFGLDGGIVLGPSHEITPDTPIENIIALYRMQD
ncbi:MAG: hypothetical protein FVQ80_16445 [Planctomycetes bacterium]|nr:hypothetical protein [Planctomycetota bacterium]